jgi:MoaA/NifB/PqqE/SkfB family radical SAM enzyme
MSIDALSGASDGYIQKTLDRLEPKLRLLCDTANFALHVNVVLCPESIDGFDAMLAALRQYPVMVSVNVVHDKRGAAMIADERYVKAWRTHFSSSNVFSRFEEEYGAELLAGDEPDWHCRAGGRSLYVDEFGEVHFCAGQRNRIRRHIEEYSAEDVRRFGSTVKECEKGCSVFCVYRASLIDNDWFEAAKKTIGSLDITARGHDALARFVKKA